MDVPARVDRRNAIVCAFAAVAAVLLSWPFANTSFNDDWSYSFTVLKLTQTGHLIYNGWASASIIEHAYWGWLWVKAFGFSFDVLRFSTLPLAAGSAWLCYALARRAGLQPAFAVFAALVLCLSPMFVPLAASYMTDVPGLFFTLFSLYALLCCAESSNRRSAMGWLFAGIAIGLIGGTGRQIVWVAPLVIVPYVAWIRRADWLFAIAAILGWLLLIAAVVGTLHWFSHQPYSQPEPTVISDLKLAIHKPLAIGKNALAIGLTTILLILPAGVGTLLEWRGNRRWVAGALLVFTIAIIALQPKIAIEPWMGNMLAADGVMGAAELPGHRAISLVRPIRLLLSLGVFGVMAGLVAMIALPDRSIKRSSTFLAFFLSPLAGKTVLPMLTLFAMAYLAMLLPRCARDTAYDRYALPLMPCVMIPLLLLWQSYRATPSLIGWGLLGIYTFYAIGATQELLALGRARAMAADRLQAAGIPRTQIDAGFEFNDWTELESSGYVNSTRLTNPPGAYRKNLGFNPSVHPIYRIEHQPGAGTETTPFGTVEYWTLLPKFHRRIYIDRIKSAP